ncbi:uncharacterized protein LOC124166866 [Ischnura elegans]|uniref:uncharacterized protein LOC124166866 n=1 Tax=Ischnura elegans TaxID=197161 RepID=UPI001ED866C4|nr:uncharacterized protein LOC124166866 [Ischnura elegans]XP_046400534.1 uncharacterized protein LOC124166866 [Ischnura elegans]XP_046400535.1 uncharacterized protein LOC124166866 [Ischnura elegans]
MATETADFLSGKRDEELTCSGESYVGAGAKDSHHGYTFQFHLLMLYAMRALNLGMKDFMMATEMAHAGKFDDVVVCFPKENGKRGRCFQFVQAKHSLNRSSKEIRPSQLLDRSGGPFSLVKYFESYRSIKQNSELLMCHDEVKSLVICSNMSFRFGESVGHFNFQEDILKSCGEDEILGNKLLKFKSDFEGRRELVLFLKNDLVSLPRAFASAINKSQRFTLKAISEKERNSHLYKSYLRTLTREVLHTNSRSFSEVFIQGKGLSPAASHFRDELWFQYLDKKREGADETAFIVFLSSKEVEISVNSEEVVEEEAVSPKALAKCIIDMLMADRSSKDIKVSSANPALWKNIEELLDLVLVQRGKWLVFDSGFLSGQWLPERLNRFKESLTARLKNANIELSALGDYAFEMDDICDVSSRYCGDRLEQDMIEFLEKLSFSINQPGILEMESQVKAEVAKFLNVSDASNPYSKFFTMMYSWAESKDARYMTEKDVKRFFYERKREMSGGIRFNLRHPVFDFIGREQPLKLVHELLQGGSEASCSMVPRAVVVSGLGGMGKSELAREYAKRHHPSQYGNVIWIDSENRERLEWSFKTLAFGRLGILKEDKNGGVKDIEIIVQETYDFFCGKNTLFVFDNVVYSEHLAKFFPKFSHGDEQVFVLMTARTRDWKGFPIVDLDNFSPEEAFEFVQLSMGQCSDWDSHMAHKLTKKLDYFPLALKQACSYIEEMVHIPDSQNSPMTKYLSLFDRSSEELLKSPFRKELLNSYSETTYTTMKVAMDHVRLSKIGKPALHILNVITFLSPDSIPIDTLRNAYPRFTTKEIDASLDLLQKLAIVKLNESQAIIHRMVQSVNKISLRKTGQKEEIIYEAMRLAEVMDVEHQMSVWNSVCEHKRLVRAFCRIPGKISEQLSKKLMSSPALDFMQGAIKELSKHLGPEDYETLCARRDIGRILYYDGKFEEAANVQRQILEDMRRVLGKDDPDTFVTMHHYGMSLKSARKYEESLRVFQELLVRGSTTIGADHPNVLEAKNQVTKLQNIVGKKDANGQEYLGELVGWAKDIIKQKEVGHLVKGGVENSSRSSKKGSKVEEYQRMRVEKAGLLGKVDLDDLLKAYVILAEECEREGKYSEACEHYKSCLDILGRDYASDHPKVKLMYRTMVIALIKNGSYGEALKLLKQDDLTKGNIWGESYSMEHWYFMARALWGMGESGESINSLVQSFREGRNEQNMTNIIQFCMQLMEELAERGRYLDLVSLLQQLYETLKEDVRLGPYMETIFATVPKFSELMKRSGYKKEALEVLKYAYQSLKLVHGENDVKTLGAKLCFAHQYCDFGSMSAKKKGVKYLLEVHTAVLDKDPSQALDLMQVVLGLLKAYCEPDVFSYVLTLTKRAVMKANGRDSPLYHLIKHV